MASSPVQLSLLDNFIINLFINSSGADWEGAGGQRAWQAAGGAAAAPGRASESWSRSCSTTLPCCCNNYHGLQYLLRIKLLVGERPGQDWGGKVIPQLLRVSPHTQSSFILMPFEMPDQCIPFNLKSICFRLAYYHNWSNNKYLIIINNFRWAEKF